jgi:hypothetical protein
MNAILQEDHGGSNLKISSCNVDESGALMLSGMDMLDGLMQARNTNEEDHSIVEHAQGPAHDDDMGDDDYGGCDLVQEADDDHALKNNVEFEEPNQEMLQHQETPSKKKPPVEDDPWEQLDPHSVDTVKPRPVRKGRPYTIPLCLRKTTKQQGQVKKDEPMITYSYQHIRRELRSFNIKLDGPVFPEFALLLRHRRKQKRKQTEVDVRKL